MYVYVVSKHGKPLMPCSAHKARLLLKSKKACVIKRTPFTVKLLYGSAGYKQNITLGVDAGSKHIGLSASTEMYELYREKLTPRNDVVNLLSTRRELRRARRNRKTRYRSVTKMLREKNHIPKSHTNDALCIAQHPQAIHCENNYQSKAVRHHNRQIHQFKILKGGIRKNNQAPYIVKGFRLWDKVRYDGQECFISGRRSSGYFALKKIDGTVVSNSVSYKKILLLEVAKNYLIVQE